MAGVSAHAEPDEFGVYFRAARFGMLKLFKHHDARALAQNKAITVAVPGPRCRLRVIIAGAQGPHGGKAANTQGGDRGLSPAGEHHISVPVFNHATGLADTVQTGGAGSHH